MRLLSIGRSSRMLATTTDRGKPRRWRLSPAPQPRRARGSRPQQSPAERLMVHRVELGDHAAADEAALRIARVQVVDRGLRLEAGERARGAVQQEDRAGVEMKGQVRAHQPARIREPVREGAGLREQQELRRADCVPGQHDLPRAYLLPAPLRVEIARAGDAAVASDGDLDHAGVRAQIQLLGRERARNRDREGRPLGMDEAAVGRHAPP